MKNFLKGGNKRMKSKTVYGVLAFATMALLLIGGVSAFGGFGKFFAGPTLSEEEKDEIEAFRDQVQTAIESADYETWHALMESQLTEENFEEIVEQHDQMQQVSEIREKMKQARENGDTETFEELKTQLQELMPSESGFGNGSPKEFDMGMRMGGFGSGNCHAADAE